MTSTIPVWLALCAVIVSVLGTWFIVISVITRSAQREFQRRHIAQVNARQQAPHRGDWAYPQKTGYVADGEPGPIEKRPI